MKHKISLEDIEKYIMNQTVTFKLASHTIRQGKEYLKDLSVNVHLVNNEVFVRYMVYMAVSENCSDAYSFLNLKEAIEKYNEL